MNSSAFSIYRWKDTIKKIGNVNDFQYTFNTGLMEGDLALIEWYSFIERP